MIPSHDDLHSIAPTALAAERLQIHFAIRTLASAAHALREHAPDDSHSNLGVTPHGMRLFTHELTQAGDRQLGLELTTLKLCVLDHEVETASFELEGHRVEDALAWAGEALGHAGPLPLRTFPDFPEHDLEHDGRFQLGSAKSRSVLGQWFAMADRALNSILGDDSRAGVRRIWPHHFDLGGLVDLGDGRGVGLGMSPGDQLFDQPYLYTYAYPTPEPYRDFDGPRGSLSTKGFEGYLLLGEELLAGDHPRRDAETFFGHALACAETSIG